MALPRVLVVGAGGHGRSVAEAIELAGEAQVVAFCDDGWPALTQVWHYPVWGAAADFAQWRDRVDAAVVAIGNNAARQRLSAELARAGIPAFLVVHPAAQVSSRARLGEGCTIMAGAVIGTESVLGAGVIVNCGAVVDHHAMVADFGHLGVGACMAGGSALGQRAWLQAGVALGYGGRVAPDVVLRCSCELHRSSAEGAE